MDGPTKTMRNTDYARELVPPAVLEYSDGTNEARLERLYVKAPGTVEIRLSWWKNGRMQLRPLDLPEEELWELLALGIREGVLTIRSSRRLRDFVDALSTVLDGESTNPTSARGE